MIILGIETSCDETAAAIVQMKARLRNRAFSPTFEILSSVISSQVDIHAKTGGIVPEVAAREHIKNILPIIDQALKKASLDYHRIDVIAVTGGPGLITSLLVGAETAKVLAYTWNKPIIKVNHLEGHIYSNWLRAQDSGLKAPQFPLLALVVSGGHTELVLMKKHLDYQVIGQTRDDAAGEAFDKVAKLLGLGYPGGPIISQLAQKGKRDAFKLPRPMINENNFDFSFSGLKTAVLYLIKDRSKTKLPATRPLRIAKRVGRASYQLQANLCASFEQAAIDVLVEKTIKAAKKYKVKSVLLSGGVAANELLRESLKTKVKKELPASHFSLPTLQLCTDNAAMIAAAGYYHATYHGSEDWQKLSVDPNWELT
ncbi:MAG: tRNA (adenosine(37)-N6)-threonylcarbamoyltransferase complex transferase subunit TsaD [Candidatus Kerfeldbacteria bacterium CG_4_10_14_0_8_um_filter_42_10]|uniref:tRNA N6-adenosine threonylcarbamoyltransferase n=1 Tax=Candidatus Kerfeldbacteria bacterium CG_4_10_14_0_8_um_filter_42_10 TaxID=2014248 RepID=A0A2M7RHE2_9BACT|nr:MAG: tRNA (adenosine(37)-N6)-threonylcarbamoyltransferase complex transferase subunit TsaD [Candidatus Kerfeldbacteria bacterium CG_4_10_14_0_8_um_filter_42_10]